MIFDFLFLKSCYSRPSPPPSALVVHHLIKLRLVYIIYLGSCELSTLFYKDMISLCCSITLIPRLFISMPGVTLSWRILFYVTFNIPRFCDILYNDGGFWKLFVKVCTVHSKCQQMQMSHWQFILTPILKPCFLIFYLQDQSHGQYSSIVVCTRCL